jgi:hypothetical protein
VGNENGLFSLGAVVAGVGNLNEAEDDEACATLAKLNGELDFMAGSAAAVLVAEEELSLAPADWKRGFELGKSEDEDCKPLFWIDSDGFGDAKEDRDAAKGLGFAVGASDVALGKLPPENIEEG